MQTRRMLAVTTAAAVVMLIAGCAPATTPHTTASGPSVRLAESISTSSLRHRLRAVRWIQMTAGTIEFGTDGDEIPLAVVSYGNANRAIHLFDVVLGKPLRTDYSPDAADDPCSPGGTMYVWGSDSAGSTGTVSLRDDADESSSATGVDAQVTITSASATSVHGAEISMEGPFGEVIGTDFQDELGAIAPADQVVSQPGSMGEETVAMLEEGWSGSSEDHENNPMVPEELGVTGSVKDDELVALTAPDTLHGSKDCPRTDTEPDGSAGG